MRDELATKQINKSGFNLPPTDVDDDVFEVNDDEDKTVNNKKQTNKKEAKHKRRDSRSSRRQQCE